MSFFSSLINIFLSTVARLTGVYLGSVGQQGQTKVHGQGQSEEYTGRGHSGSHSLSDNETQHGARQAATVYTGIQEQLCAQSVWRQSVFPAVRAHDTVQGEEI